jgi:hypothetical protein
MTGERPSVIICVCGKVCTSKAGFTLHSRKCVYAKEAERNGDSVVKDTDIVENIEFVSMVQDFVDKVQEMAVDANKALLYGNRSAGRRARMVLSVLKEKITPMRREILESMKEKGGRMKI